MVARHAWLEDGDTALLDLTADERVGIELMSPSPDVYQRRLRRCLHPRLDLLLADLDRALEVVTTLLAEHAHLSWSLRTNRAPHACIVPLPAIAAADPGHDPELGLDLVVPIPRHDVQKLESEPQIGARLDGHR